jgi:hypothetical protein
MLKAVTPEVVMLKVVMLKVVMLKSWAGSG